MKRKKQRGGERARETKHTFKFHEFLKRATKANETNYNELYLYCPREKPTKHFGVFRLKYILYYIYIHVTKNVFFSSSSRWMRHTANQNRRRRSNRRSYGFSFNWLLLLVRDRHSFFLFSLPLRLFFFFLTRSQTTTATTTKTILAYNLILYLNFIGHLKPSILNSNGIKSYAFPVSYLIQRHLYNIYHKTKFTNIHIVIIFYLFKCAIVIFSSIWSALLVGLFVFFLLYFFSLARFTAQKHTNRASHTYKSILAYTVSILEFV